MDGDLSPVSPFGEVRDAGAIIGKELVKPEPDALEVAKATSRLAAVLNWLGKKLDMASDNFIKAASTTAGAAAGAAVVAGAAYPPFRKVLLTW